jgi:hypothetical protein
MENKEKQTCVICQKEIENPSMDSRTCARQECQAIHKKLLNQQFKSKSEKHKLYIHAWHKSNKVLRERHKEEFKQILKEVKDARL